MGHEHVLIDLKHHHDHNQNQREHILLDHKHHHDHQHVQQQHHHGQLHRDHEHHHDHHLVDLQQHHDHHHRDYQHDDSGGGGGGVIDISNDGNDGSGDDESVGELSCLYVYFHSVNFQQK